MAFMIAMPSLISLHYLCELNHTVTESLTALRQGTALLTTTLSFCYQPFLLHSLGQSEEMLRPAISRGGLFTASLGVTWL